MEDIGVHEQIPEDEAEEGSDDDSFFEEQKSQKKRQKMSCSPFEHSSQQNLETQEESKDVGDHFFFQQPDEQNAYYSPIDNQSPQNQYLHYKKAKKGHETTEEFTVFDPASSNSKIDQKNCSSSPRSGMQMQFSSSPAFLPDNEKG